MSNPFVQVHTMYNSSICVASVHFRTRKFFTPPCVIIWPTLYNVFPLISGGKVALNRLRPLPRFYATFPPDIKGKTLLRNINKTRFKPSLIEKDLFKNLVCTPLCKNNPAKLIVFRPIFPKMADLAGCC